MVIMAQIKRIAVFILTLVLTFSFTACGEQAVTTSELMEKYGLKERFTVWLYKQDRTDDIYLEGLCKRYDAARSDHLAITVKSFYGDEYTVDLFIQKLSAEIMAGRGTGLDLF